MATKGRRLLASVAALLAATSEGFLPTSNPSIVATNAVPKPSLAVVSWRGNNVGPSSSPRSSLGASRRSTKNEFPSNKSSASFSFNIIPAVAWVSLLLFAFVLSPGKVGSAADSALLESFFQNPTDPSSLGTVFYVIFNLFAVAPVVLLQLLWLQDDDEQGWLPVGLFWGAASAVGYFALGPYLTLRNTVDRPSNSWWVDNAAENKLLSWGSVLLTLFFYSNVVGVTESDLTTYLDLVSTSKFGSVSSVDLLLLSITSASLIPKDYELRTGQDGTKFALLALLFPWLGSTLYCALRPPLPDREPN